METDKLNGMDEAQVERLVRKASEGDGQAVAELYALHRPRLLAVCRRLLRSPEDAEDAVSELFVKMHSVMGKYDPAYPFVNWLMRVASNHCLDRLRRRGLESRLFLAEESAPEPRSKAQPSPLSIVLDQEQSQRLRTEIDALPEHYRLPLNLRFFSEMSYAEIGEALGIGKNRVATLIFRAKKALRVRCAGWRTERMQ